MTNYLIKLWISLTINIPYILQTQCGILRKQLLYLWLSQIIKNVDDPCLQQSLPTPPTNQHIELMSESMRSFHLTFSCNYARHVLQFPEFIFADKQMVSFVWTVLFMSQGTNRWCLKMIRRLFPVLIRSLSMLIFAVFRRCHATCCGSQISS